MKNNKLNAVIDCYDKFIKDIDFANLPDEDSEEYRTFILKTADEKVFSDGRYSDITEGTLEFFQEGEYGCDSAHDLSQINSLTDDERRRWRFYHDLTKVCYPLFDGQKVDWTQWPWNMDDSATSTYNRQLWRFIMDSEYLNLKAAVCYDLMRQAMDCDDFFSSVARAAIASSYNNDVKKVWKRDGALGNRTLATETIKFAEDYKEVENHMLVGRQLGFDIMAQSVYDAVATYCGQTYYNRQVTFALEMSAWMKEHWTLGDTHPTTEKMRELEMAWNSLMERYDIYSPDEEYSWDILTMDVLGIEM